MGDLRSTPPPPSLSTILTPTLLSEIYSIHFPWPPSSTLDFAAVGAFYFCDQPSISPALRSACYHQALVPLSKLHLSPIPPDLDLLQYLPPPSSNSFPEQALGLILLLDQAPRHLLTGKDARYLHSYFDPLSRYLVKSIIANIPPHLRPWRLDRWTSPTEDGGLNYPFPHAILRQIFFFAPMIHSDDVDDQALQIGLMDGMRVATEHLTSTVDPWRETQAKDAVDVELFPRLLKEGPPGWKKEGTEEVRMEEYVYWTARVMYAHVPIVRRFGRYPRWVRQKGGEYTAEEREYMELTGDFGMGGFSEEDAQAVREDVEKGRWRPLGE